MLSPNTRSLYTAALNPPPGHKFDEAIGTTFSMDPAVLLSIPLHLALLGSSRAAAQQDGIAVLEAIRRLAGQVTVYAQRGRILVPPQPSEILGLLESMAVEVTAPRGGVFHPKLWVLRFVDAEKSPMLRLMILSRNLTNDQSWDLALTLEGAPGKSNIAANRELGELIAALPSMVFGKLDPARREQADRLAGEVRRTRWDLPNGFDEVSFHVLGRTDRAWSPKPFRRAAIISPFCADAALQGLCERGVVEALVTRPETLQALTLGTRERIPSCRVLHEAAETEDGEDMESTARDALGLHAKAYIMERGWKTHLVVGSANATNAALLNGRNIEVLAELVGQRSRVGGVESLMGDGGLGESLAEGPTESVAPDPVKLAAEKSLAEAREMLVASKLRLRCTATDGEDWDLTLEGLGAHCPGVAHARAWPITLQDRHARVLWEDGRDESIVFRRLATAAVTGLTAFELEAAECDLKLRFVLNIPVDGLPSSRDDAILQTVVRDREGFLRYLRLLLVELGDDSDLGLGAEGAWGSRWAAGDMGDEALLEDLVRAYSRHHDRLTEIKRVVESLTANPAHGEREWIVSDEFLDLWRVFERALGQTHERV